MAHWRLAGCPRCGGDVFTTEGLGGSTAEECLQCGWEEETTFDALLGMWAPDVPVEAGKNGNSKTA